MKKTSTIISILAGIVGAMVGALVIHQFSGGFDKVLVRTASGLNATLPMMVDQETRLDATMAGPGKKFLYTFTLINFTKAAVDVGHFQQTMRPKLVASYRTNPKMKSFRDHNVELVYQYKDKAGEFVCELVITTKDL